MATIATIGLSVSVDELGELNAQIAALRAQAETLKDYIKANAGGLTEVKGERYKARIKSVGPRKSVSYKGVAEGLKAILEDDVVYNAVVNTHTNIRDGYVSVSLYDL